MGEIPQPMLRVVHERSADEHVIYLAGEMDLGNADQAREALMHAIESESTDVIVDISELEFIDSTGIAMLLEAQAASRRDSDRLAFRRAIHPEVARIMELTALDQQLEFVD